MELEFAGGLFGTGLDCLEIVISVCRRVNFKQPVEDEESLFRWQALYKSNRASLATRRSSIRIVRLGCLAASSSIVGRPPRVERALEVHLCGEQKYALWDDLWSTTFVDIDRWSFGEKWSLGTV